MTNINVPHLNITDRVWHKFDALAEAMGKSILHLKYVQETKLEESFPANQFAMSNFKTYMHRKGATDKSGGILMYVRSHIPPRLQPIVKKTCMATVLESLIDSFVNECVHL